MIKRIDQFIVYHFCTSLSLNPKHSLKSVDLTELWELWTLRCRRWIELVVPIIINTWRVVSLFLSLLNLTFLFFLFFNLATGIVNDQLKLPFGFDIVLWLFIVFPFLGLPEKVYSQKFLVRFANVVTLWIEICNYPLRLVLNVFVLLSPHRPLPVTHFHSLQLFYIIWLIKKRTFDL